MGPTKDYPTLQGTSTPVPPLFHISGVEVDESGRKGLGSFASVTGSWVDKIALSCSW